MIKRAVETSPFGFTGLNQAVLGRVSGWLADSGIRALERIPQAERATSSLQRSVGNLLESQGAFVRADDFAHSAAARLLRSQEMRRPLSSDGETPTSSCHLLPAPRGLPFCCLRPVRRGGAAVQRRPRGAEGGARRQTPGDALGDERSRVAAPADG